MPNKNSLLEPRNRAGHIIKSTDMSLAMLDGCQQYRLAFSAFSSSKTASARSPTFFLATERHLKYS